MCRSAWCVQASVAGTGQPRGRRGLTQRREGARLPRAPHSGDGGATGRASAEGRRELTLALKSPSGCCAEYGLFRIQAGRLMHNARGENGAWTRSSGDNAE